ncbi:phosphoadenosine phosphosulfate reductase [Phaeospirillum tilakii]|uniref:Phosphoadenosine phosphosulfate reductase n=1 Tax=Phaeospirillum tilakii TaxID=741673 RepID=A0ABW5CC74_9PROT
MRIARIFDDFPRVCVSFSAGKDSTVMLHLVMEEAAKRRRRVGVLFIDWECQYKLTISHAEEMFGLYDEYIDPYWVALPITTVNAVSQFEPEWIAWEPGKAWVRNPPDFAITDPGRFPFYRHAMKFEDFVPAFGAWFSGGQLSAMLVGIRSDESLNRYRTMSRRKSTFEGLQWTTWMGDAVYNAYPIYDWKTEDIWTYCGKFLKPYNKLYDRMHQAGVPLSRQRICEPFGSEQRQGLWLFQVIEPETWALLVARVNGANSGSLYAKESGNILGNTRITKPEKMTWEQYAMFLLATMPSTTAEHYKNKIATYLKWYRDREFPDGIPDWQVADCGAADDKPSWRRICKTLVRNDYWCKTLSFSPTKTEAYEKYKKLMKQRREEWGLI